MSVGSPVSSGRRKRIVWGLVVVLAFAHHDAWFWSDATLLFGFLPIGLGYHALISVAAGIAWALVVHFAWPHHIEEWAATEQLGDAEETPR